MQIDYAKVFAVAFVLGLFAVVGALRWLVYRQDVENITEYLESRGYREIKVHYDWFDFDRDTCTYKVRCRSPKHKEIIHTACKVNRGFHSDNELYWKDPL